VRGFADEHDIRLVDEIEEAVEAVEIGFEPVRGSTNHVSGTHAHLSVDCQNANIRKLRADSVSAPLPHLRGWLYRAVALQRRNMACTRVRVEVVEDSTDARHMGDGPDQPLNFRLEDGPS
jgi:hypothetical protein